MTHTADVLLLTNREEAFRENQYLTSWNFIFLQGFSDDNLRCPIGIDISRIPLQEY